MDPAFLLFVSALIYFLPAIVAMGRGIDAWGGVVVVDLFLGWTFIGWVVALAWACAGRRTV